MGSSIGVPIAGLHEGLYGTLCHFDFPNHPLADDEFLLLERVGRILPRHLAKLQ